MSTSGRIYDTSELDRVKGWADMQNEDFTNQDKNSDKKELLISGAILITTVVIGLFLMKKFVK